MRHELLTQRALLSQCKKGHAESAFCDACRTSPESEHMFGYETRYRSSDTKGLTAH